MAEEEEGTRNPQGAPDPDLQSDDKGRDCTQGGHGEDGGDGEPGHQPPSAPGGQSGRDGSDIIRIMILYVLISCWKSFFYRFCDQISNYSFLFLY